MKFKKQNKNKYLLKLENSSVKKIKGQKYWHIIHVFCMNLNRATHVFKWVLVLLCYRAVSNYYEYEYRFNFRLRIYSWFIRSIHRKVTLVFIGRNNLKFIFYYSLFNHSSLLFIIGQILPCCEDIDAIVYLLLVCACYLLLLWCF